ncbi:MAG TPA: VIT1/CCC1 transporter family protein [Gaiellaceae bacterium]|nr:VIT1/CCC1 transporter family protein [Gaiellaceae bacterium]
MDRNEEIALWRASLQDEVDSAHVYRALADSSRDGALYARLAEAEERHAAICRERLRLLGDDANDVASSRRARLLATLGRRFGPRFVMSSLTAGEGTAEERYAELGEAGAAIAAEERAHARLLDRPSTPGETPSRHEERHRLGAGNTLRASVLGANDGLLSNFSLVMGVAGAQLSRTAVLITGLSGLLAGAGSMALGEWISVQSSREYEEHELDVERRELELYPEAERAELAALYAAKGIPEEEAGRLAESIVSNQAVALDTMAREELGIDPELRSASPWKAAGSSFGLFCVGAIVPILPYFFLGGTTAVVVSTLASALALFGIGAAITLVTATSWIRSGFRQVAFGVVAAALTYGVGRLLGRAIG